MIKQMSIDDYPQLFALWKATPNMGLRSLDDSREGILLFLNRNPNTNFTAYEDDRLVGAILCGNDGRRGYIYRCLKYKPDSSGKQPIFQTGASLRCDR